MRPSQDLPSRRPGGLYETHGQIAFGCDAATRQIGSYRIRQRYPRLGLRVRKGGSRVFIFQYALGRKQRRIALGRQSAVNFADVRKTADQLYAKVKLGQDPAAEKAEAKNKAGDTFKSAIKDFLEWQKTKPRKNGTIGLKSRSVSELERHLLTFGKPLHKLRLDKISRTDIAKCLSVVEKTRGPIARNRGHSSLSSLFSWAMLEGKIEVNPVSLTRRNNETDRKRILTDEELKIIWNALDPTHQYSTIFKLLILTGQRREEIGALRWSEIKGDVINLPLERTKNGLAHWVPLSPLAREVIGKQPRRANADGKPRDLIFGFGNGGFSAWSMCKKLLDEKIAKTHEKPLAPWWLHDLRRTVATRMADIGIQPHVIEAVLNHASGHKSGVAGVYNRSTYEPEKKEALTKWAEELEKIVNVGNASRKAA